MSLSTFLFLKEFFFFVYSNDESFGGINFYSQIYSVHFYCYILYKLDIITVLKQQNKIPGVL